MLDESSDDDLMSELAEEFVARLRSGEHPDWAEYAERHPELAEDVRELFPALILMEQTRPTAAELADASGTRPRGMHGERLERLGEFRLLREVGRGGMGIVYEAEQESLGRRVALKVLPTHALLEPHHFQRFDRESRAAGRLHHANIVPVFGVGQQDGLHYNIMQFIQGPGLDQVLEELKRLREADRPAAEEVVTAGVSLRVGLSIDSSSSASGAHQPAHTTLSETGLQYWQSVARIGVQVADALAYANSQGVLHRDIKPSNLLLDIHGIVWVTDFRLAKAMDSDDLTHTGDIVGTLRYLAPERLCGKSDERSDTYSLGVTLYELITQCPAFQELDRTSLLRQIAQDEPRRPS